MALNEVNTISALSADQRFFMVKKEGYYCLYKHGVLVYSSHSPVELSKRVGFIIIVDTILSGLFDVAYPDKGDFDYIMSYGCIEKAISSFNHELSYY